MHKFVIGLVVVIGFASAASAQQRGVAPTAARIGVQNETVKGAPYSAEVVNESVQTLGDGNRIVRRSAARVYRDSEGRVRRDQDRPSGSPEISISDPVAGAAWTLDADNRTARQMPAFGRFVNLAGAADDMERLSVVVNGLQTYTVATAGGRGWIVGPGGGAQDNEERLTPRTIEGVRVEGVRRTSTIAAGTIGNERAIVVSTEEWTSSELKVLVLSEHSDPRTGTTTYKLVNIKRGDPQASLFQVPPDYTVVQGGRGRGGERGGARGER